MEVIQRELRELQVILKTVERCNLACSYCYYFFMGDESYRERDPVMRLDTFAPVVKYLEEGVKDLAISEVNVVFHGGEPTLQKPRDFLDLVQRLRTALDPICKLTIGMQTNGYHLSDEWLKVIAQTKLDVGVSIDGPEAYHDANRKTVRGGPSHAKIAQNVQRLHSLQEQEGLPPTGVLSVLQHEAPIEAIYRHFRDDLKFKSFSFLLPDRSRDDPFTEGESAESYGDLLIRLFDLWADDQEVDVREIRKLTRFFQNQMPKSGDHKPVKYAVDTQVVVIHSTGEVKCDDSLTPALAWTKRVAPFNVRTSRLRDFIEDADIRSLRDFRNHPAESCRSCRWLRLCGGGVLENRYSTQRGFDNPSVYCEGLKKYYAHVTSYLVENGYPQDKIDDALNPSDRRSFAPAA